MAQWRQQNRYTERRNGRMGGKGRNNSGVGEGAREAGDGEETLEGTGKGKGERRGQKGMRRRRK